MILWSRGLWLWLCTLHTHAPSPDIRMSHGRAGNMYHLCEYYSNSPNRNSIPRSAPSCWLLVIFNTCEFAVVFLPPLPLSICQSFFFIKLGGKTLRHFLVNLEALLVLESSQKWSFWLKSFLHLPTGRNSSYVTILHFAGRVACAN